LKKPTIAAVLLVALLLWACPAQEQDLWPGITQAKVQRVVDGDTFVLENGERVRFIGVNAPEMATKPPNPPKPAEPGAEAATKFTRDKVEGKTVWLEAEGNDRDRYGRLRRYVWLSRPTNPDDESQIRRHQLNALLLSNGHAVVLRVEKMKNETLFRQLEKEGKGKKAANRQP